MSKCEFANVCKCSDTNDHRVDYKLNGVDRSFTTCYFLAHRFADESENSSCVSDLHIIYIG